jgi:GR25 family glycosyltransferase involved in LPS biosynthesis
MEEIINNYDVNILSYINGSNKDNLLNNLPIYIINLKSNVIRRHYIKYIMHQMRINYNLVIVDTINDDIYDKIEKINIKVDKFKLGCVLSHLYCIKICIDSNFEKFLILEDDIIFHKNFDKFFTLELLNLDFDILMLGAVDFNYDYNKQFIKSATNDMCIYKPNRQALGAHANIYSNSFAKKLYKYKITNKIVEFDVDFKFFYNKNNIYICTPNLIVCELSTTNLNHNFGYNFLRFKKYIKQIFPDKFTYKDYKYITIDFINYAKKCNDINSFKHLVEDYIKTLTKEEEIKLLIYDSLLQSGYSINDIIQIISYDSTPIT